MQTLNDVYFLYKIIGHKLKKADAPKDLSLNLLSIMDFLYQESYLPNNTIYQCDIERILVIQKSSLNNSLETLINLNFVEKLDVKTDKRKKIIRLTSEGIKVIEMYREKMNVVEADVLNLLTKKEQVEFQNLLEKLVISLKKEK